MGKPRSRVAEEAREAEERAAEMQRKIRQLSTQISNPQKYFTPRKDANTQSAVERFRRYFSVDRASGIEKRKPTRAEMRVQRTWTVIYLILAFFVLLWVIGKLSQVFRTPSKPVEINQPASS